MIAGIGCRAEASTADLLAAIDAALTAHERQRGELAGLATGARKAGVAAIREAAQRLSVPLMVLDDAALAAVEPRLLTRSAASAKATGSPSLSEAAALAGAGKGARLLGPRTIAGPVTCALAEQNP